MTPYQIRSTTCKREIALKTGEGHEIDTKNLPEMVGAFAGSSVRANHFATHARYPQVVNCNLG